MAGNAFKKLAQLQVGTTAATVYTAPALTQVVIKEMRVVVPSTKSAGSTIALYHGGTTDANMICPAVPLAPGEFGIEDATITLQPGDTIAAVASVANTVTLTIYGVEMS